MLQLIKPRTRVPLTLLRELASEQTGHIDMINSRIGYCRWTKRSNCIGTALYIVGEIANDVPVSTVDAYRIYLKPLLLVESPFIGCLVAWHPDLPPDGSYSECEYTVHMGIVTGFDGKDGAGSPLITSRSGRFGYLNENQPLSELRDSYHGEFAFYMPRIFVSSKNGEIVLRRVSSEWNIGLMHR